MYLTTTPNSNTEVLLQKIEVAENVEFPQAVVKLIVKRFENVGEVMRFVCCKHCNKKRMDNIEIGKKNIKCCHCKRHFRLSDLHQEAVINLTFLHNNEEVKLSCHSCYFMGCC